MPLAAVRGSVAAGVSQQSRFRTIQRHRSRGQNEAQMYDSPIPGDPQMLRENKNGTGRDIHAVSHSFPMHGALRCTRREPTVIYVFLRPVLDAAEQQWAEIASFWSIHAVMSTYRAQNAAPRPVLSEMRWLSSAVFQLWARRNLGGLVDAGEHPARKRLGAIVSACASSRR